MTPCLRNHFLLCVVLGAIGFPAVLVAEDVAEPVDFERHVVPLLAKFGCNSGACHGSFEGRGGFRLSLFSYDPLADYLAITRGQQGRRVNVFQPEESLLLKKPTMQVAHQGGRRFARDSSAFRWLRDWIAQGAMHRPDSGTIKRLWITGVPSRMESSSSEDHSISFAVRVLFADGTESDVTEFAEQRTRDEAIAEVTSPGSLELHTFGETVLIARYLGQVAAQSILIPRPMTDGDPTPFPPANRIDELIGWKLSALRISPSELSSDAEFLRRVSLHVIGQLPDPNEVQKFLADTRPDKRHRQIDRLLAHPLHAAVWATRFSEWTGNDLDQFPGEPDLKIRYAQTWQNWFRRRFAENVPYDEIVRGVLCATSRNGQPVNEWIEQEAALVNQIRAGFNAGYARRPHLDLFWRRGDEDTFPAEDVAERLAAVFLGVRIQCAKCHKHPFDQWTQNDYRAFANVFAQIRHGQSTELRIGLLDVLEARRQQTSNAKSPPLPKLSEVYLTQRINDLEDPATSVPLAPTPLGGPAISSSGDRRIHLAAWLTGAGKETLARAFVNRTWAMYFGRGLVEPMDAFSATNPPSHPELLEWLTRQFLDSGFDVRHLERLLLTSRTYQLSSIPNAGNRHDQRNYSHSAVQVLPAATAVDVLHDALGVPVDWGRDFPPGTRAVEVGASRVRQPWVNRTFELFQRPERKTPCDCERPEAASVRQSLFLMSDVFLGEMMRSGRLKKLLQSERSDAEIIEELFLASLSRFPHQSERQAAQRHAKQSSDRNKAFEELWWALLNTREFLTLH